MEYTLDQQIKDSNHQSVLKEYYARYLKDIRGLSDSSVKHYFDALNNISKRLKSKGIVQRDIYEIADLERLENARSILFSDPDFITLNERGRRMYSAGLNNYCRFAAGKGFSEVQSQISIMDMPIAPDAMVTVEHSTWKRSGIIRAQAIEFSGYMCEINKEHQSFISEKTNKPYMEGHHAVPMNMQGDFNVSLDVYANIICLCPICHRRIHYGLKYDRVDMVKRLYDSRAGRLENSGIILDREEFIERAAGL